jgi:hypothetical protein
MTGILNNLDDQKYRRAQCYREVGFVKDFGKAKFCQAFEPLVLGYIRVPEVIRFV